MKNFLEFDTTDLEQAGQWILKNTGLHRSSSSELKAINSPPFASEDWTG